MRTLFQNRPPLIGREAIVEFLKSAIISSNPIVFPSKQKILLISNDGNQVVEIGYFKVIDSANTIINSGNYMSLFEKRNGKYVCVRDMSASDMPLEIKDSEFVFRRGCPKRVIPNLFQNLIFRFLEGKRT